MLLEVEMLLDEVLQAVVMYSRYFLGLDELLLSLTFCNPGTCVELRTQIAMCRRWLLHVHGE